MVDVGEGNVLVPVIGGRADLQQGFCIRSLPAPGSGHPGNLAGDVVQEPLLHPVQHHIGRRYHHMVADLRDRRRQQAGVPELAGFPEIPPRRMAPQDLLRDDLLQQHQQSVQAHVDIEAHAGLLHRPDDVVDLTCDLHPNVIMRFCDARVLLLRFRMINNIPVAAELEETSLRLYFTAWSSLFEIITEKSWEYLDADDHDAIEDYIRLAQPDLQMVYSLIQQSQELGLKAKLCSVSPFLLLLGQDVRSWAKSNADFSSFRTIDASDLMRVADAIFPGVFSENFKQQYENVRGNRNKIQHLGAYKDKIDPMVLVDILANQYAECYPNRKWLPDRLSHQSRTRWSSFYDRRWNERSTVMTELPKVFEALTNHQYKKLFGFSKKTRRYACISCISDAGEMSERGDIHTATLVEGVNKVYCHLCESEYEVRRMQCKNPECKSDVIGDDTENVDTCLLCESHNESSDHKGDLTGGQVGVPLG
ncbi:hypothetical protein ABNQ39_13330 [Azospirillum sp. A26]|uniref:hypothetical protein n=1 Tax=Azospirillum sp. A26 TaxID=3160607 RepID=UPI00366BB0F4